MLGPGTVRFVSFLGAVRSAGVENVGILVEQPYRPRFGYAVINFMFFMTKAPSGGRGANQPAEVWRGFSGHWMAFYSAALAILYSAARTEDTRLRCPNGHLAPSTAIYCTRCGQPVMRVR